jgi:hypothetical protein
VPNWRAHEEEACRKRQGAPKNGLRGQNVEEAVKESSLSHEFQSPEEYSMSQFANFPLSIFIVTQPSWARSRSGTIELIFTGQ